MISLLAHNLKNIPGWHTNRHIVVIESDDWGSIRMPSKDIFHRLSNAGIGVDRCHYCSNDSIASCRDLDLLFDVLNSIMDKDGHTACITANAVVANPDFDAIRRSGFNQYSFVRITEGFKSLPDGDGILDKWKEGMANGCFVIQSHGREHLHISRWMHCLQGNYPETKFAFEQGVYGISLNVTSEKRRSFLPAFAFDSEVEEQWANETVSDGLRIFEEIFGYKSKSFIAPNYVWGRSLEKTLAENGVKYIQGHQVARYCTSAGETNRKRLRYMGKRNDYGQIDLCRNASFEPSENPDKDWVDSCLADIKMAFRWRHPAIVCSHRVNFVGSINPSNRDRGLRSLSILLKRIRAIWPDVEFMSSVQLGDEIIK